MIAIIDYEAGNLTSVERAVRHLGFDCKVTRDLDLIAGAERVIFPGVGAAGAAMDSLRRFGLDQALRGAVAAGKPVLGICLGCQIVLEKSEEDLATCLGLVPGRVTRFKDDLTEEDGRPIKIPHMGWNRVAWRTDHPVFRGLDPDAEYYFVHSYYPDPASPDHVAGTAFYGLEFAAALFRGSLVATQFHPEKSGRPGLKILGNFLSWNGRPE